MRLKCFIAAAVVAAVMALVVPAANADMVLTLDDTAIGAVGSLEVIMADGVTAAMIFGGYVTSGGLVPNTPDLDGLVNGLMVYAGSAGPGSTFAVNVVAGFSDPPIGPPAQIDLLSGNITSMGAGTLIVGLTDTGFAPAVIPGPWTLMSDFGGTAFGFVSSLWYADEFNGEFVSGTAAGAFGPLGPGAFAASGVAAALIPLPGPFSLSTEVTVMHGGNGITSFDSLVMIPAPGAVLLGMMGLGMVGWLRRRFA